MILEGKGLRMNGGSGACRRHGAGRAKRRLVREARRGEAGWPSLAHLMQGVGQQSCASAHPARSEFRQELASPMPRRPPRQAER